MRIFDLYSDTREKCEPDVTALSAADRWDNDALETWVGDWQDRQERLLTLENSLPGFGYHFEADFEVERHQRHNKVSHSGSDTAAKQR